MVTNVIIDYLNDDKNSAKNKYEYIRRLNLNYTDLFELLEIFKYNDTVYSLLRPFVSYEDNKLSVKIETQKRKNALEFKPINFKAFFLHNKYFFKHSKDVN